MRKTALAFLTLLASSATSAFAVDPSLTILSPHPGSTISGSNVTLKFSTLGLSLVDYKIYPKATYGQGHINLWLDQTEFTPTSAIKVTSDSYTFTNLKTGPHTLVAELVTNDNASLIPQVTTSLDFTTAPINPIAIETPNRLLALSLLAFGFCCFALYFTNLHITKLKTAPTPKPSSKTKKTKPKSKSK